MFVQSLLEQTTVEGGFLFVLVSLGVLAASYAIYNRFFHPLHHIPGPFLASVTPFVQLYYGARGDRHLWLYGLHAKYGTHVRAAPNFVSVNSDKGLQDIYGYGKRTQKADFYNAFPAIKGVYNTHNAIDKAIHGRKRRVLSQAFSDNALKSMEESMLIHVRQFCDAISGDASEGYGENETVRRKDGEVVRNMANWFGYLAYDVMGQLCFGKGFDMLVSSSRRHMVGLVDRASNRHYVCGLWMPLHNWHLDQIFIRKLTNDRWNFIMNGRAEVAKRAKERTAAGHDAKKDFFYYLLNAKDPQTGQGLSTQELWSEANVLMIAGSDTTSTTLCSVIFYLTRNPHAMETLKKEVRSVFSTVEDIVTGPELNSISYLIACLDEALRLAPAVPGASPREILEPGAVVDGVFFPAGTDCGTSSYSIHRQERYYREPLRYLPERWIVDATCKTPTASWVTTKEDVERSRGAFCTFSIGPRGCIGKAMAFMEMRVTLARMMFLFDIERADGGGEDATGHFELVDHFTSAKNGPNVIVRKRDMTA